MLQVELMHQKYLNIKMAEVNAVLLFKKNYIRLRAFFISL